MIGVRLMLNFFKRKKKTQIKEKNITEEKKDRPIDWELINNNWVMTEDSCEQFFSSIFKEPETNASNP